MKVALIFALIFISICTYSQSLELEGTLKLKESNEIPSEGTIRFNDSKKDFEGWNGFFWVSLTGGATFNIGEVIDADGNHYKTLNIGDQWWMAENLRTSRYHNISLDPITFIENDSQGNSAWEAANYGAWSLYGEVPNYNEIYGKLYNWYAVNDARGICPTGWHVPIESEFDVLRTYLVNNNYGHGGGGTDIGKSIASTLLWDASEVEGDVGNNPSGNNRSGFSGLPSGAKATDGGFYGSFGNESYWWSKTLNDSEAAVVSFLTSTNSELKWGLVQLNSGLSIRCLMDEN